MTTSSSTSNTAKRRSLRNKKRKSESKATLSSSSSSEFKDVKCNSSISTTEQEDSSKTVPSSWSKAVLASVASKKKRSKTTSCNKRQLELEYATSSSSSSSSDDNSCDQNVVKKKESKHKNNFWNGHMKTSTSVSNSKRKKTLVTPSPAPSHYFSPSTVTIDLLTSSSNSTTSNASHSSSSGGSSSIQLPDDVIDIDAYPSSTSECCTCSNKYDTNNDLSEAYLQTYSKEYHNHLFSKEETNSTTDSFPKSSKTKQPRTRHRAKLEFTFVDNQPIDYMSMQPHISKQMRAILIDWLIEVQVDLVMQESTLHLAVRLLDRALSCTGHNAIRIEKERLQCLGCACMSLSSRLNEVSPPSTDEFESMSDKACTTPEIYAMALRLCVSLNFRLYTITPYHFCHRFLRACCLPTSNPVLDTMVHYLLQVSMLQYDLSVLTKPSLVTASALFLARVILGIGNTTITTTCNEKFWSKTLQYYTTYTPDDLKSTVKMIYNMHQEADESKYSAAFQKYSGEKCYKVAYKMMILEEDLDLALSDR